jgi:uncharacterized protein YecT (DUF1311 family)
MATGSRVSYRVIARDRAAFMIQALDQTQPNAPKTDRVQPRAAIDGRKAAGRSLGAAAGRNAAPTTPHAVRQFAFNDVPTEQHRGLTRMKKATRIITISLALLMYGSGAQANESTAQVIKRQAPAGITDLFYRCVEDAGSESIALAACQSAEKERQDTRLNTAYEALLNKQRGTAKDNLIRA